MEQDLIRDVGMKSIGKDWEGEELMSLRTSVYMMVEKESSRVPVNGRSSMGEAWRKEAILAEIASLIELILD